MLKRTNKLTALLAAATSVAALAPTGVMAADYTRIPSKDATVYSATAFKDGSYVIDGDVVEEDDDAVYYVQNGKYTELEDVESGSDLQLYGDHYLSVDNGDYYIDLNTGKVTDDDLEADTRDDLEISLKKALRNVDRYDVQGLPEINESDLLPGNKYGELWYQVTTDDTSDSRTIKIKDGDNEGDYASIYTDAEGNYIDANYNLGKIRVLTTSDAANAKTTSKYATIENSEDSEDAANGATVSAKVDETVAPVVIGQDDNNIYRVATIKVSTADPDSGVTRIKSINGINVDSEENPFEVSEDGTVVTFQAIQKISKAQASDDIDDANYAKTVTNYLVCKKEGKTDAKVENFQDMIDSFLSQDSDSEEKVQFSIVDGTIVAYKVSDGDSDEDTITTVAAELKTQGSLNYLDVKSESNEDCVAVDTDVNGNLYRLDEGYIYKFDNTDDWDKLYRVDGSMENMSIYDSNDMVVWDKDNEVYSLVGFNASNTSDDSDASNSDDSNSSEDTAAPVVAGWNQAADGTYTFVNADGTTVKGWFQSPYSGKWFYMDTTTGVMQTGWVQSPYSGKWFFMDLTNGDMQTGWVQSPYSGKWYYMNPSNGDMMTGWIQSPYSGKWYYMDASGAMVTNTTVNGYVLGADGAWIR